jgi:hypothetical protein
VAGPDSIIPSYLIPSIHSFPFLPTSRSAFRIPIPGPIASHPHPIPHSGNGNTQETMNRPPASLANTPLSGSQPSPLADLDEQPSQESNKDILLHMYILRKKKKKPSATCPLQRQPGDLMIYCTYIHTVHQLHTNALPVPERRTRPHNMWMTSKHHEYIRYLLTTQ